MGKIRAKMLSQTFRESRKAQLFRARPISLYYIFGALLSTIHPFYFFEGDI